MSTQNAIFLAFFLKIFLLVIISLENNSMHKSILSYLTLLTPDRFRKLQKTFFCFVLLTWIIHMSRLP